jgi:hypothetical protein
MGGQERLKFGFSSFSLVEMETTKSETKLPSYLVSLRNEIKSNSVTLKVVVLFIDHRFSIICIHTGGKQATMEGNSNFATWKDI